MTDIKFQIKEIERIIKSKEKRGEDAEFEKKRLKE